MKDQKGILSDLPNLSALTVLVTGANRGFGAALALILGACKANVIVHYRKNRGEAESILKEIQSMGGKGELVQADLLDESVRKFQKSQDRCTDQ